LSGEDDMVRTLSASHAFQATLGDGVTLAASRVALPRAKAGGSWAGSMTTA